MIRRGEIYWADLDPVRGHEQAGTRPVLIIQNDVGNQYSSTTIAAAITSRISKKRLPVHVEISVQESGLPKDSLVLLEQIRTLDMERIMALRKAVARLQGRYKSLEDLERKIQAEGVPPDDHMLYTGLLEWRAINHELSGLGHVLDALGASPSVPLRTGQYGQQVQYCAPEYSF